MGLYMCSPDHDQPVADELLPPEKMVVPTTGHAIDFRAELKALLNSIMANYGQFMEMLVRYASLRLIEYAGRFGLSGQHP